MNEICKGNPNPPIKHKTKLGRVMKLTSIPLFVFTTGVYASVHSPNMRIKSDIMIIEKPSIVSTPQQNTRQITGTVIDATGMPIIGANVMVKGTTNGTITDIDGKFTLEVAKDAILQVSYIGYMNQEIPVGNKSVLSISLQEDTQKLDEVVVIGYGTMKKSDITGAISSVSEEKIARQAVANVSTALQGLGYRCIRHFQFRISGFRRHDPYQRCRYGKRRGTIVRRGRDARDGYKLPEHIGYTVYGGA